MKKENLRKEYVDPRKFEGKMTMGARGDYKFHPAFKAFLILLEKGRLDTNEDSISLEKYLDGALDTRIQMVEAIADLVHQQWAHWTRYFLDNLTPENKKRWVRQIKTPYNHLSEKEKNSDREWAEKFVHTILEYLIPIDHEGSPP